MLNVEDSISLEEEIKGMKRKQKFWSNLKVLDILNKQILTPWLVWYSSSW